MKHAFTKASLVEIVERYTTLIPTNKGFIAQCPLHDDNNPSFVLYPNDCDENSRWLCYGCHPEADDVISFVMLAENCSFQQALKICTSQVTCNDAFLRELEKQQAVNKDELLLYAMRANAMTAKYDLYECNQVFEQIDSWVNSGKLHRVDKLLSAYGV